MTALCTGDPMSNPAGGNVNNQAETGEETPTHHQWCQSCLDVDLILHQYYFFFVSSTATQIGSQLW
jgi:hypothetical protein